MRLRRSLSFFLVGSALLAVGLACGLGAGGAEPQAMPFSLEEPAAEEPMEEEAPSVPTALSTPSLVLLTPSVDGDAEPQPAIPESRRLTLEFPPDMRTGDSARIRMQLEVDDRGNIVPTAMVEGNVVTGEVIEIPNLYETHFVVAESRLDMAGMEVQPPGLISEPLTPGKPVTFYWSIRPEESGSYEGTVWLYLRFIPMTNLSGEQESRITVSVQFLEIEANSFLGFLSGGTARGIGTLGSLIGSVLGIPFVDDFVKWLWGRIKRR